ncbi:MAG: alpha/beta fold hydrolase [Patescibacteria group bacterium]
MKNIKKILLALVVVLLTTIGGFLIYAADYYKADEAAQQVLRSNATIKDNGTLITIPHTQPTETALIFYPGAKVEHTAYLPLLEKVSRTSNIKIFLVRMPLRFAIFNQNAAARIMSQNPDITKWYLGGHSLGGAMASSFASNNQDKVQGLILLGAYVYGSYPKEKSLTIYGTLNTTVSEKVDYTENVVAIEGGNHAQFGNYGKQKGDQEATITSVQQQQAAVEAIKDFLSKAE